MVKIYQLWNDEIDERGSYVHAEDYSALHMALREALDGFGRAASDPDALTWARIAELRKEFLE